MRGMWAKGAVSRIWNKRLDFGRGDLVLLDLLIKRASRDAEPLRRLLDPASFLLQHAFDVLLLELEKSQSRVEEWTTNLRVTIELKVGNGDRFLVTQQHRTFDYIA